NYSKGFRAPTLLDLYWPYNGFSKGNPDLKPETSKEIEGGIKVIEDKSLLLISYFKRELENGITWSLDENFVYTPQNIEKIKLQGFEGLIKIEKVPFIFSLNFIFYKERKNIENDSEKTLLLIPTYNSGFLIGYKERNFSLSYRLRLIGPHYSIDLSDYQVKNVQHAIFQDLSFTLKLSKFINMSLVSTNIDNKPFEFQIGFPLERRRIYVFAESNF
ncbi:MAG: TonB-dependent receptor, partial [candidate division WOR-3 bacterium]